MIKTTLPNNLTRSDIDFLQRQEDNYLLHHELTSKFLSLVREYPDCRREDFSSAFGKTLNFLFDKESGELRHLRNGKTIQLNPNNKGGKTNG